MFVLREGGQGPRLPVFVCMGGGSGKGQRSLVVVRVRVRVQGPCSPVLEGGGVGRVRVVICYAHLCL